MNVVHGVQQAAERAADVGQIDILNVGPVFSFAAPMAANLVGFQFFMQGAQLDLASVGGAPCNLGLRYGLTNGYRWRAY